MKKKLPCKVLIFLGLFISIIRLEAQQKDTLLGYESFLTQPRPLDNAPGGRGWNQSWYVQNGDVSIPGYQVVDTAKLTYPGLKVTGNFITGGRAYLTAGRTFDVSEAGPFKDYIKVVDEQRKIGKEDSTIWVSFLLKTTVNRPESFHVTLSAGNYLDPKKVFAGFGCFGDSSKVNNELVWTLRVDTNYYRTAQPVVLGQTVLAVMRIKFSAVDTVSLFLNPTGTQISSGLAPTAFNARGVTGKNLGIESLAVLLGNGPKNGSFDEFRIGNSFRSVVPVADITLPVAPVAVASSPFGNSAAVLTWEKGMDNDSIWGYFVFQNKVLIDTVFSKERTDTIVGLTPGATYTFGITAFDASGNLSKDTTLTTITLPLVTDLARSTSSEGVAFFPNPANHKISYKVSQNIGVGMVSIIDQVGNVVINQSIDGIADGNIDISSLSAGSYILLVETEKVSYHQLMLKQ